MKVKSKTFHTVSLTSLIFLLAGCGSGNQEVSYKSGGMTHTFAEGARSMPGNFPLPTYPGAEATGLVSAQDDKSSEDSKFLILSSSDTVDKISKYYQDSLKTSGWKLLSVQMLPNVVNISAQKGDLDGNVMLSSEGKATTISLSLSRAANVSQAPGTSNAYTADNLTPPTD